MSNYILRLDDACEKRNIEKWDKIEQLVDHYSIKPLVGVIPCCKDPQMNQYKEDTLFWSRVAAWREKGWTIALHGYEHVYCTDSGGINPVNRKSEFAGLPLETQRDKIRKGVAALRERGIEPQVFFAPSHTFDENTLEALRAESGIRIVSDTIAWDIYGKNGFIFVPQQTGRARKLPFRTVTFCYHPNAMKDADFARLEAFLSQNQEKFISFPTQSSSRRYTAIDRLLKMLYMAMHR